MPSSVLLSCVTYYNSFNIFPFFSDFYVCEWIKLRNTENYPEAFHNLKTSQNTRKVSNTQKIRIILEGLAFWTPKAIMHNLNWFICFKNNKTTEMLKVKNAKNILKLYFYHVSLVIWELFTVYFDISSLALTPPSSASFLTHTTLYSFFFFLNVVCALFILLDAGNYTKVWSTYKVQHTY